MKLKTLQLVSTSQGRKAQENPVLLRVESNAGLYGATGIYSSIRQEGDMYAFLMQLLFEKK